MIFLLIILGLLFGIAFFQSTHGLFSALMMTVLTICCAAAAIGTHEWVAIQWVTPYWKGDYAAPVALAVLFGLPLVLLRLAADTLIRRSCLLPSWLDRIGAGFCGLITALVMAGMVATCIQMIPFDHGNILGFARVTYHPIESEEDGPDPEPPAEDEQENGVWLAPDRFMVALSAMLSDGLFSGRRSFTADHPDFIQEQGWINAAPAAATRFAPPGSIAIVKTEPVQKVYKSSPPPRRSNDPISYEPKDPAPDHEFRMIRVQLKDEARGDSKWHIFTLRQFRLVGRSAGDGRSEQYFPIAIQHNEKTATVNRHVSLMKNFRFGDWPVTGMAFGPKDGNDSQVEIVFEIPVDFEPDFLEYKRSARVEVTFDGETADAQPATGAITASSTSGQPTTGSSSASSSGNPSTRRGSSSRRTGRKGAVRGVAANPGKSFFGDRMGATLTSYRQRKSVEIKNDKLVDGHIVGYLDEQDGGNNRPLKRFEVDPDKRLLHFNTENLRARSGIGKILSQTVKTIQNYFVEDDRGRRYQVIGKYAVATVNGRKVFEIQYFSSPVGRMGGLGKFEKIKDSDLRGDYEYFLLFLVEPGAKIVRFSTGGSATRAEDLGRANLVAPK